MPQQFDAAGQFTTKWVKKLTIVNSLTRVYDNTERQSDIKMFRTLSGE